MICNIENCVNTNIAAKGLCWKHYRRFLKTGDTRDPFPNKGKLCKVENCLRDAKAKGMCFKHYSKIKKYKNPKDGRTNKTNKRVSCSITGCELPCKCKHLCANHYSNYRYYKRKFVVQNVKDYFKLKEMT